ncbi:hypothetical protein [Nocardiopsis lambiniae]|uniref:RNA polymerase sigma-70 region 4 domain-containing protein n=1 Tax=Nocardiopsis lambiniae TaxID=3075539 RepID=A0ABU2M4U3_9ACTN|nr:hypothetical protein [Nocardiopsis sp. DSM 44743]MDT0327674.1 hypothetical protein [Nocardiopsis sp. DSM 44743]
MHHDRHLAAVLTCRADLVRREEAVQAARIALEDEILLQIETGPRGTRAKIARALGVTPARVDQMRDTARKRRSDRAIMVGDSPQTGISAA